MHWIARAFVAVAVLVAAGAAYVFGAFDPEPTSDVDARRHSQNHSISAVTFRAMDAFFPVAPVAASPGAMLEQAEGSFQPEVTLNGETMTLDAALRRTHTNAFLVIKDGRIIAERYFNGASRSSRFIGWSLSKSVLAVLMGVALDRGVIASLEDPVEAYLPQIRGSAFEGVTLRQMLMMRAGTSYSEHGLLIRSDLDRLVEASLYLNARRFTDFDHLKLERESAPGAAFNYSTLTTSLIGRILESAWKAPLARITETALWRPAGMEQSAYWLMDGDAPEGAAFGGGGFAASARDFARLGLLMLDGGRMNGAEIVSADWVDTSTRSTSDEAVLPGAPRGYGLHWWTLLGTEVFEAIGVYGQYISVDRATNTVIVKLSHWPVRGGRSYFLEHIELFEEIRRRLR